MSLEAQIAVTSTEDELSAANPTEVVISGGNYQRANFGPQTNNQVVKANDFRNANITHLHHHHYYSGDSSSVNPNAASASTDHGSLGEERRETAEEGSSRLSDTISIFNEEPLRRGKRVFRGKQSHISGHRLVAIKFVPFDKKTRREVNNLLKLSYHPNVVQIIESQKYESATREIYIAMELCSSVNLHDHLQEIRNGQLPFDEERMMSYTKQLVAGIEHIHTHNIIHGDLKPGNVLLSEDRATLKVSDFGLSKELQPGTLATRVSDRGQGTDGFRAPETYCSDVISFSCDIFCLAIVIFMMWANGRHPFGEELDLLNYNIKKNIGCDLSGVVLTGVKREQLLDIIKKMLRSNPEERPLIQEVVLCPFISEAAQGLFEEERPECSEEECSIAEKLDDMSISPQRTFDLDEETLPKEAFEGSGESGNEAASARCPADGSSMSPSLTSREHGRSGTSSPEKEESSKTEAKIVDSRSPDRRQRKTPTSKTGWVTASEHEKISNPPKDDTYVAKGARMKELPSDAYYTSEKRSEKQRWTFSHTTDTEKESEDTLPRRRARSELRREKNAGDQQRVVDLKSMTYSFSSSLRGRLDRLGLNSGKLCEWRLVVRYKGKVVMDKTIKDLHNGRRICYGDEEKLQTHSLQKLHINCEERLIHRLREIKLPKSTSISLFSSPRRRWLGLAIWFDKKTSQLRGASYGRTSLYFFDFFASPMSKVSFTKCEDTCILSMENYVDWLERRNCQGVSMGSLQGPAIRTSDEAWQSVDLEIELFPNVIKS